MGGIEMLYVILAGIAGWIWGAIWYSIMAKPWMTDVGLTEETINRKNPVPYIAAVVFAILCAGMIRHVFVSSGVDTLAKAIMSGAGLGLFVAAPWLATNYLFAQRPTRLIFIDAVYAIGGCLAISIVLSFGF